MFELDAEILQDFLTESGELLESLETDLIDLEAAPSDPERINQVFRALHTIKGSASFLALTNLVEAAHSAESALNTARNGGVVIDRAFMDLLLETVDLIRVQMAQLAEGAALDKARPELVSALELLAEGKSVDASSAVATTTVDEPAASMPSDPIESAAQRTRFELDGARAELFDLFVDDLEDTISRIGGLFAELGDEAKGAEAADTIAELAGDVRTTADFFDFAPIAQLLGAISETGATLNDADPAEAQAATPRLEAIRLLLDAQRKALPTQELLTWAFEPLLDAANAADSADPQGFLSAIGIADTTGLQAGEPSSPESDLAPSNDEPTSAQPATAPAAQAESPAAPTAEAKASQPEAKKPVVAVEQTIRVDVSRLERLMNLVGELVLQKNRIGALTRQLGVLAETDGELAEQFELAAGGLDRVTGDMQTAVMRTRMQPLDKLFGKYPRLIRDLATKTGKQMRLEVVGGDTEVDRSIIEELGDPLVHIMRNSADHGLELPEDREANGKPREGVIRLHARHEGGNVSITISDDGWGLSRTRIGGKAVERGLVTAEALESMSDSDVHRFIMAPGFSTAEQVSDLSGRGVGMDVVRTKIESINGVVDLESKEGAGTSITIRIPLTIAIMPAMMVAVGNETYALPLEAIHEILRPEPDQLAAVGQSPVLRLRDAVLPVVDAATIFETPTDPEDLRPVAVVVGRGDDLLAIRVSSVLGQQEIVIKPLDGIDRKGPISGATVRDDGGVSLIVDIASLMREAG